MRFDSYEIQPVKDYGGYVELCPPEEADFWSLYGRLPNTQVVCIGDFSTEEGAEYVKGLITGT